MASPIKVLGGPFPPEIVVQAVKSDLRTMSVLEESALREGTAYSCRMPRPQLPGQYSCVDHSVPDLAAARQSMTEGLYKVITASSKGEQQQSMAPATTVTLDHIVILVPHSYLALPGLSTSSPDTTAAAAGPPAWFRDLFTFSPGGRHTDGATENVLVLLADGVYLEFIAFTPRAEREDGGRLRREHKWGGFVEGSVVDWAVTVFHQDDSENEGTGGGNAGGRAREDYDAVVKPVTERLLKSHGGGGGGGGGDGDADGWLVVYGDLIPGGRKRPDGAQLEWATVPTVSVASSSSAEKKQNPVQPGQAPFWCLDETPRHLRVPYRQAGRNSGPSRIEHPNTGAVGVAKVQVTPAPGVSARSLGRLYGEVFPSSDAGGAEDQAWTLFAPEGTRYHRDGSLQIQTSSEKAGHVVVSLYTDKKELVGRKVGGEVEGGKGIWFELVGV
ncbi:hypothetical protein Micbo1qcDRAFT_196717 [Microdochium bolleyi]|uniref:Glyoxalase-like domain-containing protein n=1 Tax=Microdochium bolleyi TaxID=196109 RepID=A0A136IWH6_9PEZI|nr:hypothetical protein Micbo1qcDRAFT_196717 [Microdochium bolleyi]